MSTKLYIANLGKYNEGELVGEWIDLPIDEEKLHEMFVRIKVGHYDEDGEYVPGYREGWSFYEEVAIHDYESDILNHVGEYDNIMELSELIEELEGLTSYETKIVEAYMECYNNDLREAIDAVDRCTYWDNMSLREVAEEEIRERYCEQDIPDIFFDYFNYEAYAAGHLAIDSYYECTDGVLYVG